MRTLECRLMKRHPLESVAGRGLLQEAKVLGGEEDPYRNLRRVLSEWAFVITIRGAGAKESLGVCGLVAGR